MTYVWLVPFVFAWFAGMAARRDVSESSPAAKTVATASPDCTWYAEDESKIPADDVLAAASLESVPTADHFVRCRSRLVERTGADAAVLEQLSEQVQAVSNHIVASASAEPWRVKVYHPDARMRAKLRFAFLVELKLRQVDVSDALAPTVDEEPHSFSELPKACVASAVGGGPQLTVYVPDRRVTSLLAGVCHKGSWQWLL